MEPGGSQCELHAPRVRTSLFGLPVTGAITFTPHSGGVVHGSAPVQLPGVLVAAPGTLSFIVSAAGVLQSASVAVPATTSVAQLVSATIASATFNTTTGLWTVTGTAAHCLVYRGDAHGNSHLRLVGDLSSGTVRLGKVDLAGALMWNALTLAYSTTTHLWTASSVIVGRDRDRIGVARRVRRHRCAVDGFDRHRRGVPLQRCPSSGSTHVQLRVLVWKLTSTPATAGGGPCRRRSR